MTTGARILVVDDEPQIRRSLEVSLEARGYAVITAASAEEGLSAIANRKPDIVVLDLILPQMDGLEFTREVRKLSAIPIIVLSAVGDERRKVEALELGADDYVTKPFGVPELHARIRSILRRSLGAQGGGEPSFVSGELSVNFDRREVRLGSEVVKLTPTEYELLKHFIRNAGKVLTQRMLLTEIWGPAYADETQYLRVFVGQLRKKLERDPARPRFILTDPGVGYRFIDPEESSG